MADDRLPTALWVEAHLRQLTGQGIPYYITQTGAHAGGMVLLKLIASRDDCSLLTQQRDLGGNLVWINATKDETLTEQKADDYIKRSISRDPDLWVIEIEDREKRNPFEEKKNF